MLDFASSSFMGSSRASRRRSSGRRAQSARRGGPSVSGTAAAACPGGKRRHGATAAARRCSWQSAVPEVGVRHDEPTRPGAVTVCSRGVPRAQVLAQFRLGQPLFPSDANRGPPAVGLVVRRVVVEHPDDIAHPVAALIGESLAMSACSGCGAGPGSAVRQFRLLSLNSGPITCSRLLV